MKIFECKSMRYTVVLAAALFIVGMALTTLMGVPGGERALAMMTMGQLGFLMILAVPVLLLVVAIATFFPQDSDGASPC